ncbi:hypothetical protein DXG01_008283 [Tephrocybe rancida]|nr:hypothetical protein DXG01_008283 [Tephrocybe rancida]
MPESRSDSNYGIPMDDHLGTSDFPLKEIIQHSTNRFSARQDRLNKIDGTPLHGILSWECGYFSKTTLEQHFDKRYSDIEGLKKHIEDNAENKLRETKTRSYETGEVD